FLKAQIGDKTTIDFSGGYGPAVRLIGTLATGKRVDGSTGREQKADPVTSVAFFLRNKLGPTPRAAVSAMSGQDPSGHETDALREFRGLFTPISADTAVDAWKEYGVEGLALMVPELFGAGVNIRQPKPRASLGPRPPQPPRPPRVRLGAN